jgi:hypothetical protein
MRIDKKLLLHSAADRQEEADANALAKAQEFLKMTPDEKKAWVKAADDRIAAERAAEEKAEQIRENRSQGQKIRKRTEYAIKDTVKANVTTKNNMVVINNKSQIEELAKEFGNTIDWKEVNSLTGHKSITPLKEQRRNIEKELYKQIKQGKGNTTATTDETPSVFEGL